MPHTIPERLRLSRAIFNNPRFPYENKFAMHARPAQVSSLMDHLDYLRSIAGNGGRAGTERQNKARASNLALINLKRQRAAAKRAKKKAA